MSPLSTKKCFGLEEDEGRASRFLFLQSVQEASLLSSATVREGEEGQTAVWKRLDRNQQQEKLLLPPNVHCPSSIVLLPRARTFAVALWDHLSPMVDDDSIPFQSGRKENRYGTAIMLAATARLCYSMLAGGGEGKRRWL